MIGAFDEQTVPTAEFIRVFNPPLDIMFWVGLMQEENRELMEELGKDSPDPVNVLKEAADLTYVVQGAALTRPYGSDLLSPEQKSRLEDIGILVSYTLDRAEVFLSGLGIDVDGAVREAILRVHRSNMSKCDPETGEPIRDPDTGKILKGPHYQPPVLDDLVGATKH